MHTLNAKYFSIFVADNKMLKDELPAGAKGRRDITFF